MLQNSSKKCFRQQKTWNFYKLCDICRLWGEMLIFNEKNVLLLKLSCFWCKSERKIFSRDWILDSTQKLVKTTFLVKKVLTSLVECLYMKLLAPKRRFKCLLSLYKGSKIVTFQQYLLQFLVILDIGRFQFSMHQFHKDSQNVLFGPKSLHLACSMSIHETFSRKKVVLSAFFSLHKHD